MKKHLLTGALALTIGLSSAGIFGGMSASADEIQPAAQATTATTTANGIEAYTIGNINIVDHGSFENVGVTPYIVGVPNTGKIAVHYTSTQLGVGLLSTSYFVLGLPEQLSLIASQPELAAYVTATVKAPGINHTYQLSEIKTDLDRITLENPSMCYILKRDMSVDITIDYGKILDDYPAMIDYIDGGMLKFSGATADYDWIDLTLFGNSMAQFTVNKPLVLKK